MDTDTTEGERKRGQVAPFPGSQSSPGEPSQQPDCGVAKKPSLASGETWSLFRHLFSKFSRDRSKVPAESEVPKSDDEPPGPDRPTSPRPDTEAPKQVLISKEIQGKIIELVHQALGPDAIALDGQADVKNLVGDMRKDLEKKCTTNGSLRKKISKILKRVEQYSRAVDVAIQHQPQVAQTMAGIGKYF